MKINLFALILAATIPAFCHGQVDDLARQIASTSPSVRAASLGARSEVEEIRAENRLPDPAAELENLWGPDGANKFTASISQEFEFPTTYHYRALASRDGDRAIEYLHRSVWLEKALEAKLLIIDYIFNVRQIATLHKLCTNLDSLASVSERAFRGGEIGMLDLRKVQLERNALLHRVATLEAEQTDLIGQINALGAPGTDMEIALGNLSDFPVQPFLSLADYEKQAADMNPTLAYNALQKDSRQNLLKSAKASRLPSISLGYIYNREEGATFHGLSASLSLPVWSNSARLRSLSLQADELMVQSESVAVAESANIAALHASAKRVSSSIESESAILSPASEPPAQELLLKALRGGQISVLDYLSEANYFVEAELQLEEARHHLATDLAKLNKYLLLN